MALLKDDPAASETGISMAYSAFLDAYFDKEAEGALLSKLTECFRNQALIDELLAKQKQGVNVRLVISDEDANKRSYKQLSENFDLMLIPRRGWSDWNRMHDKFCIIDLEYVMHGSYNWTKTANENDETLATALDRDFVKKFADEFISLYNQGHRVSE